jgi:primosomal protein N''
MHPEQTTGAAKRAAVDQIRSDLAALGHSVEWGSWLLAANLAEQLAAKARFIREQEQEDRERQAELGFPSDEPPQAHFAFA